MSLAGIAKNTLEIVESGHYQTDERPQNPSIRIDIHQKIKNCLSNTLLYTPNQLATLSAQHLRDTTNPAHAIGAPILEVTDETTAAAARRLYQQENINDVALLNFASAKNPGGGFLGGAKAQEEDLARCSALYSSQITQPAYYAANRQHSSLLYTDHLIYSPSVPFFRDDKLYLVAPYFASVITAPAPNAGAIAQNEPRSSSLVLETLRRRAAYVLSVFAHHQHRTLVLGAWGCGVFRNDPAMVAAVFVEHLRSPQFAPHFDRVVFAIYDRQKTGATPNAFRRACQS